MDARLGWAWAVGGAVGLFFAVEGCSGEAAFTALSGGGPGSGGADGGQGAGSGLGGGLGFGGSGECSFDGAPCGDEGICAGGTCCDAALACGASCCDDGQVCSFQECVVPGGACVDSTDCAPGEYCEYSLGEGGSSGGGMPGCVSGAELPSGKCLPKPPACASGEDPGDPPQCLPVCQYQPPSSAFTPKLAYSWGGVTEAPFDSDIMMAPIVIQLDDDDCDGKVTERDIPEIVFSTFANGDYKQAGRTHAVRVLDGKIDVKWTISGVFLATGQLAGGNIDGKPGNEIVGCTGDGRVRAVDADGATLWTSEPMLCLMPSLADLDQDGDVEVIVEGAILDGATGKIKHSYSAPLVGPPVVSDIDGDGQLDVVTASQAFDAQGKLFVSTGLATSSHYPGTPDWKAPWPAVADLDLDGVPEVVVVHNDLHQLLVWRYDASKQDKFTLVRAPLDINGKLSPTACGSTSWGRTHGGGPPTIADFNGDGIPDVALAGGVGYAVLDGKKLVDASVAGVDTFLWQKPTSDCSSTSTGSTVFDFNGDGIAEVIYSDEERLRIYEGPSGDVLFETCNTTATLIEYPLVADVDNDGHADILAVSNAYGKTCDGTRQSGLRIFSADGGSWVRTRRVWNQHAYHITNVAEDGSIPTVEAANYGEPGLNNFRTNKQPGSEFAAPDAVVSVAPKCAGSYGLLAVVRNLGEAALPAGVPVGFYAGAPPNGTFLGSAETTRALYSLEFETLELPVPDPPPGVTTGQTPVYAIVDDGPPHPDWSECRTDNNVSAAVSAKCDVAN